ncbi:MAG: hypothetical protein WKF75_21090 [Singulisphaera sp.]
MRSAGEVETDGHPDRDIPARAQPYRLTVEQVEKMLSAASSLMAHVSNCLGP